MSLTWVVWIGFGVIVLVICFLANAVGDLINRVDDLEDLSERVAELEEKAGRRP
jgi:hypothetical protein